MAGGGATLRVLTLNLWNVNGPVHRRLDDLAAHLREHRPEVVALQEVSRLDERLQAEILAEAAGYDHVHYDQAWRTDRREEGLAILSRRPLTPLPATSLSTGPRDQPRALQRVEVEVGGDVVLVANTHLAWRRRHTAVRATQAERIRDVLAATAAPRILLGDLNDVPDSSAVAVLTAEPPAGAGLVDAYAAAARPERPTFSFRNPHARPLAWLLGRRVDHVLVDPSLRVVDADVVLTGRDAPVVSDHYGVRATLALGAGQTPG